MSEGSRLRIHAQITPENASSHPEVSTPHKRFQFRFQKDRSTGAIDPGRPERHSTKKLSPGDRMLRNSALACGLLLAVLAMGNINQPWAVRSSEAVHRALTMHIDLDESIGRLNFVQKLLPESALVFLNVSGQTELARPVSGDVVHEYTDDQPWLLFTSGPDDNVVAVESGIVTAVSEFSGGGVGILLDHGNGTETVYAFLKDSSVQAGDEVTRGQRIGTAAAQLYFELRENEASVDPSEKMGF